MQGEARLRGLWRIIYSKTISPRLTRAKPACAGYTGLFVQRPSFRSPREARGARFQQRVDRNSFRSPREARDGDCGRPRRVQPCPTGSTEGVALRLGARASCPRRRDARETPARRSGSRRQDAHSACPGCARLRRACQRGYASGVQAGETPALHSGSRARDARAPFRFMGACASGAHISSACPGCARLWRAYQQRLPWVRAPPARMPARTCLRRRAVALRLRARASCPRRRDAHETPALCPD